MKIELKNNLTGKTYTVDDLQGVQIGNYIKIDSLSLPDGLPDGEYTLSLIENDEVQSSELCRIGDYKRESDQYKGTERHFVQY